jgi:nitrate reductase delta subunit
MARTYKALGILLSYPAPEVGEVARACAEVIAAEGMVPPRLVAHIDSLADELADADRFDLEGRYHQLFDRSRSLSLNLYEHVHGESRDRGQAMVELQQLYAAHGFDLAVRELPDHLPVFCEFLSRLSRRKAKALLSEAGHVIAALAERLKKRRSPYQWPMLALAGLAGKIDRDALAAVLAEAEDDPDDLEALDRIWAEEPVSFGPGDAGCPKASAIVNAMHKGA